MDPRGHGLGAGGDDAQALQGALGSDVDALRRQAPAAFLEQALYALDGVSVFIEQGADAAEKVDVFRPVVTPAPAALQRPHLAELAFPEPQNMLRHIEFRRYFADRAKCLRRLLNPPFDGLNRYGHHSSPNCPLSLAVRTVDQ